MWNVLYLYITHTSASCTTANFRVLSWRLRFSSFLSHLCNGVLKSVTASLPLTSTYTIFHNFWHSSAMITPRISLATVGPIVSARELDQDITASNDRVGWVSSGSGRSTSDILWSCFSILLVCTWKCIHFNVPSIEESEARWHKWGAVPYWPSKLLWWTWLKKIGWMILIVIAPEIGVAMAMDQYLLAREPQEEYKARRNESALPPAQGETAKEDGIDRVKISQTHAFFANMGGFTVRVLHLSPPRQNEALQDKKLLLNQFRKMNPYL